MCPANSVCVRRNTSAENSCRRLICFGSWLRAHSWSVVAGDDRPILFAIAKAALNVVVNGAVDRANDHKAISNKLSPSWIVTVRPEVAKSRDFAGMLGHALALSAVAPVDIFTSGGQTDT